MAEAGSGPDVERSLAPDRLSRVHGELGPSFDRAVGDGRI